MKWILLFGCAWLLGVLSAGAQPTDTLTLEQLMERKGAAGRALLRPTRYLALDVHRPFGGFKRHRFFQGDEIRFQTRDGKFREMLYDVTDSTFTVLINNEVMNRDEPITIRFSDVRRFHVSRRIPFVTAAGYLFPIAGGVYMLADLVNTGGFNPAVLHVAGPLIVSGLIFDRMSNTWLRINRNHRLRALQTF